MKTQLILFFSALLISTGAFAQTTIRGTVSDNQGPLVGVNIFVVGSLDGGISDAEGHFSFVTSRSGEQTGRAVMLGYEDFNITADLSTLGALDIRLQEQAASIDEVVVTASTFSMGKSYQFKKLDALDVVMSGNSCGDLVSALQVLPGTQKVGEDG